MQIAFQRPRGKSILFQLFTGHRESEGPDSPPFSKRFHRGLNVDFPEDACVILQLFVSHTYISQLDPFLMTVPGFYPFGATLVRDP